MKCDEKTDIYETHGKLVSKVVTEVVFHAVGIVTT